MEISKVFLFLFLAFAFVSASPYSSSSDRNRDLYNDVIYHPTGDFAGRDVAGRFLQSIGSLLRDQSPAHNLGWSFPFFWRKKEVPKAVEVWNPIHRNKADAFRACIGQRISTGSLLVDRWSNGGNYDALNYNWNLRIEKIFPIAYYLPITTADVQVGVKCGKQIGVKLSPISGDHSYEAVGHGNDFSIIVDLRNMTIMEMGTNYDEKNPAYAKIGPGVLVAHLVAFLWRNGGYSMPMGNCFTVAMGGHLIGGGVGYWSSTYGLGIDNVLEYTIVTANGEAVVANKKQNPDLYWALRGVGPGGLGIVTEFKVKPFKAKDIRITFIRGIFSVNEYPRVMAGFQDMLKWAEVHEPSVMSAMYITSDTNPHRPTPAPNGPPTPPKGNLRIPIEIEPGIAFSSWMFYDPEVNPKGNASFLQKINEIFPSDNMVHHIDIPFLDFIMATSANPNLPQTMPQQLQSNFDSLKGPSSIIPRKQLDEGILAFLSSIKRGESAPRYFKAKSRFINKLATPEKLQALGEVMRRIPAYSIWVLVNTEGGAVKNLSNSDTSYAHRDQLYNINIQYEGTDNPTYIRAGMKWLWDFWNLYESLDGGQTYQNYPDKEVSNHLERFYGENLIKLRKVKNEYDPNNFFQNFFSIPA